MGRWIVIISLALAQCSDVAEAAPPTTGVPLPKPRPVRRDHPAPAAKVVAATLAAKALMGAAVEKPEIEEEPVQESAAKAPQDPMTAPGIQELQAPAPAKSVKTNGDCSGGKRIISAYYGQGERTASGQPFNPQGMTAAHRTLPFGTRLTVSNPRTGKSVTVVINDRGPFVSGISLDLSLGAAQAIGMRGTGAVCVW
jgi:rare lipoprotein A